MNKSKYYVVILCCLLLLSFLWVGYSLLNSKSNTCKTHWNPTHMFYECSGHSVGVGDDTFECKIIGERYFEDELEVRGDIFHNCTIYCNKPFCADECNGCEI